MSNWIACAKRPEVNRMYRFIYTLNPAELAGIAAGSVKGIDAFHCSICADTRYKLYVNGNFVCEGPCQGSEYQRYFETADLAAFIDPNGANELRADVLYLQEGSFISVYKGSRPALWFDGTLKLTDAEGTAREVHVGTGKEWEIYRDDSIDFHQRPGVHTSVPPFQDVLGLPDLHKEELLVLNAPVPTGYNLFGLADPFPLAARPIPQLKYEEAREFKTIKQGEGFMELDAGGYTTAVPEFTFSAAPGTRINIIYSECYTVVNKEGQRYKGVRDDAFGPEAQLAGVNDTVIVPETGSIEYIPFWYRAFRFVRIEFGGNDFRLDRAIYRSCSYPFTGEGSFRSSNETLNQMWDVSVNTVKCSAHEIFVDCPYYEQQQYDMDSCLEMLFALRMSADRRLSLKCITDLARSQIFDGMLQANYPSTMTQIIPDFTLFWVIMLREFIRYAPDDEATHAAVNSFLGTLDKALEAFENYRKDGGLVGPMLYWNFVDWVPGWYAGITPGGPEGEPLTVSSLLYVCALRNASEIAEYCGRTLRAKEYESRAAALAEVIKRDCYDPNVGFFKDTPCRDQYSRHTALWAVLSGTVRGDEAKKLMRRAMDGSLQVAECTFSMGSFLFRALETAGLYDEYAATLFQGWQTMLDNHCTTWAETPGNTRSECHGWSSAPAYEFSAMVLGANPAANGFRLLRLTPHMFALDTPDASGSVPTPFGTVNISLSRDLPSRTFSVNVALPDGRTFSRANCPDGSEFIFTLG